jgi:hypothetical protein
LLHQGTELQVSDFSSVGEMVVDSLADQLLWVILGWPLFEMNPQFDLCVRRELVGPAYDEFLCLVVEIFLDEWRGIHRIEKLIYVTQPQADAARVRLVSYEFDW